MIGTTPTSTQDRTLTLTGEEQVLVHDLLDLALRETRVEARRTHTPDFRSLVQHQEHLIRGILSRLSG
jgi:hypothetical protein